MKKLKSIMGYVWAVAALFIVLVTFFGNGYFSRTLATATGITVSPLYSGGNVVKVIDHGAYKTSIHRPVFDSLIGQTKKGFVQINWDPAARLPSEIVESIDYDSDGKEDFIVTLNTATGQATLAGTNRAVLSIEKTYRLRNGWAIRVMLTRQP
jgi:hypothetical protein